MAGRHPATQLYRAKGNIAPVRSGRRRNYGRRIHFHTLSPFPSRSAAQPLLHTRTINMAVFLNLKLQHFII